MRVGSYMGDKGTLFGDFFKGLLFYLGKTRGTRMFVNRMHALWFKVVGPFPAAHSLLDSRS